MIIVDDAYDREPSTGLVLTKMVSEQKSKPEKEIVSSYDFGVSTTDSERKRTQSTALQKTDRYCHVQFQHRKH